MASVIGQVSLSGTAVAALHRELRSPGTTRKVTRPVKSPSPARRTAPQGPLTPHIRDIQSQRVLFQAVVGGASTTVGEEEFEDWEPQVGLSIFLSYLSIITGCDYYPKAPPFGQSYATILSKATKTSTLLCSSHLTPPLPAMFHLFHGFIPSFPPSSPTHCLLFFYFF